MPLSRSVKPRPARRPRSRAAPLPLWQFFRLFTLRHARREWLQSCLLLAILALGVGTFLSIRIANRAAVEGFQLFTDSLKGPSDWIVQSPGSRLPVADLPRIREALGDLPVYLFPVYETNLQPLRTTGAADPATDSPNRTTGTTARLLGLDLVQFRSVAAAGSRDQLPPWLQSDEAFWDVLENPRHLLVSPELAAAWETQPGQSLRFVLRGQPVELTVAGVLPDNRTDSPLPRNLAVMDLAGLTALTSQHSVDRVEGILPESSQREQLLAQSLERLRSRGDPAWLIQTPAQREQAGGAMTAAFRLNLTVLSLIALLTGLYLIAQTLDATVSRRRGEIATLRSMGVPPSGIYRLWLGEALLYSTAAGLLGIAAGYAMAFFTVDAVTGTVRALYQETAQAAVRVHPLDALIAMAVSIGGGLLAAYLPARDAAATPPAQQLRLGRRIPPFALFQHPTVGLLALLLGAALTFLPPVQTAAGARIPAAGYLTAFLFLIGGTLVAVKGLALSGQFLRRLAGRHAPAALGASRLRRPTSRHQLALAGFVIAITMGASMAFLIQSFESTITGWLQQRLQGDLFISSSGFQGQGSDQRMSAELLRSIENNPDIASLHRSRSVTAPVDGRSTEIYGLPFAKGALHKLLFLEGTPQSVSDHAGPDAVPALANESLARRLNLGPGDRLTVQTPAGPQSVRIAAVHAEYSSDQGQLLIDLPYLLDWYDIDSFDTAAAFLQPSADAQSVKESLRAAHPALSIRDNAELLRNALFLFHQTFAVTKALQLIALTVALAGLALSMVSLLRESSREIALQRTLGMSRHEIALAGAFEGLGIALTGMVAGIGLGAALGWVLIHVINRQSFGWTLQNEWPFADAAGLAAAVLLFTFLLAYGTTRIFLRQWSFRSVS